MPLDMRRLSTIALLAGCACAWTGIAVGGNYAIPSGTVASGASDMAGGGYGLAASLGDLSRPPALNGGTYQFYPGFWAGSAPFIAPLLCLLDIDDDGKVDPMTDALMLWRAMFGLTGDAVTAGAVGAAARKKTWADIAPMIHFQGLDLDGNGKTDALTDGLMLMRVMLGLTGPDVTSGATAVGAPRAEWADIRDYLNTNCGTSIAP